jgi:transposase
MLLAENPRLPNPEAAKLLGVHENTVRYWRKRWVEEGFRLEDKPRPGRPRVFSPEDSRDHQERRVRTARSA